MARFNVAYGIGQNNPLVPIVDTQGQLLGVVIQNVSAQDFYVSPDPSTLQNVSASGVPIVGLHFPADANPPFMLILPRFRGKLYARAQSAGAQGEAITYDIGCSKADYNNPSIMYGSAVAA